MLLQILPSEDDKKDVYHPIGFRSKKLSGSAACWDAHKREAYAVYYGVKAFSYYLCMKQFIVETDHKNLLYMEQSEAYIVIPWRIYLQSFNMLLRHIPGKTNIVADWGSRMYFLPSSGEEKEQLLLARPRRDTVDSEEVGDTARSLLTDFDLETADWNQILAEVHSGRGLHPSAKQTWLRLNKNFEGHHIPFKAIQEFCENCPRCQKDRRSWTVGIKRIERLLISESNRVRIGIDTVTVTPADEDGNCCANVIVNHKTKHTTIFAAKSYDADTAAAAIFTYITRYGLVDEIVNDPGSNFLSATVKQVNQWLGLRQKVCLVDVHTSNGVERIKQELLKLLRGLVNDERVRPRWSKPENLGLIEFHLNSRVNSETGCSALELMFGTEDLKYFKLPEPLEDDAISSEWLKELNRNLRVVRKITDEYQTQLVVERTKNNPQPGKANEFQAGDLVLYDVLYSKEKFQEPKLNSRHSGPWKVLKQIQNDVELKHLCMGNLEVKLAERLTIFSGSMEEAMKLAQEDADQFLIKSITAWRGDPDRPTTMEFEILFEGQLEPTWRAWDRDLSAAIPFEDYCRTIDELFSLLAPDRKAYTDAAKELNKISITMVQPGQEVYVSLRWFGTAAYDSDELRLPNKWHRRYVVLLRYTRYTSQKRLHIDGNMPVFNITVSFTHTKVLTWGRCAAISDATLVDEAFVRRNPTVLGLIADLKIRKAVEKRYV